MPIPKSKELFDEAAAKVKEAQAIQDKADAEKRDVTPEESKAIFDFLAVAESKRAEAERRHKIESSVESIVNKPIPTSATPDVLPNVDVARVESHHVFADAKDPEVDLRHGFKRSGDFFSAVYNAMNPKGRKFDNRLEIGAAASGMNQSVGAEGGFLVPPAFSTTIWDGLNRGTQSLLSMCDQYTVEGESLTFPANAETARTAGNRYGGILGYWIAEADQITSSKAKVRQLKIEPQELAVLCPVTDKLLRNTTALEQYLTRAATDEINFLVGDAIIEGTGVGQPLGIMNSGCLVSVAKETSQVADSILEANLLKMRARCHPRWYQGGTWFINIDVQPQLDALFVPVKNVAGSENVGGFASPVYNRDNNTILGRPVVAIEYCSTIGDKGDIILACMGAYAAGVRGGIDSAMSIHLRFDYAETCFRFMFAVDGQPWLASALTPFKGSNTLSTFVTLDARA